MAGHDAESPGAARHGKASMNEFSARKLRDSLSPGDIIVFDQGQAVFLERRDGSYHFRTTILVTGNADPVGHWVPENVVLRDLMMPDFTKIERLNERIPETETHN